MAREIPEVVRAAAGLAATVLDEARKLPEALPGLPVRVIGVALQQVMKVQQQYVCLVARGDELFTGLRGENEPGLATFDDDEPAPTPGFRDSAFDRADTATTTSYEVTDADEAYQVEQAQTTLDELAAEAPATDEILDELAIDELAGDATLTGEPDSPAAAAATAAPVVDAPLTAATVTGDAAGEAALTAADTLDAEPTADVATPVETPAPDDQATTADAAVTEANPEAAISAPVDGYDAFTIAQLRGRLRGYQATTVRELLAYEEATRAREPYLRMLRNRLEKLEQQEIEASPLAPRGA